MYDQVLKINTTVLRQFGILEAQFVIRILKFRYLMFYYNPLTNNGL